jgi:hypothetical protein
LKMEIKREEGKGDREATKEKGTRFATHAEVPVQGLGVKQTLRSPHETIESMNPTRNLKEDLESTTPRSPRDQDQEYGVQPKTTGPQPKEDKDNKEDKNDKDEEDRDEYSEEKAARILAAETAVATMATATTDATATCAADAAASVLDSAHNAAASPARQFNDNLCSDVRLTRAGAGSVLDTPDAGGEGAEGAEALRPRSSAGDVKYVAPVWQANNRENT